MAYRSSPDYILCLECETPCYVFEWEDGVTEALCEVCGNDEIDQFLTPEEYEALAEDEPDRSYRR